MAAKPRNGEMNESPGNASPRQPFRALQQAAERLPEIEEPPGGSDPRYRSLLDDMEEGYFEVDLSGNLRVVNRTLGEILGYPPDELIGLNNRHYATPQTARTMYRIFNRVYRTGQRAKITDYEVVRKDGSSITLELSTTLMKDEQGNATGFRGMVRNISEKIRESDRRQRMEAQRQQVQKMEAIETLAGSMALDFNNLLMSIQGNASLMRMKLDADSPLKKNLDRIDESTDKGIHLTRQLLSFAKVGKFVVMPTDLNPIVQRAIRMFSRSRGQIVFNPRLKGGLWVTEVDRVQIGQALLALFIRAADEMPDGGEIFVDTGNVVLDSDYLAPFGLAAGCYVRISICHSGSGLDAATQKRIFEPFFSAGGMGDPRNLGLASVYGILKSHDGLIDVYSEKGIGTAFNLYLPISKKEPAPFSDKGLVSSGNGESILIVDGDEINIHIGTGMLHRLGYQPITATTGQRAMNHLHMDPIRIRLAILDMNLPDMSAGEILTGIKALAPHVIVFLASGFSRNRQIDQLLGMGFDGFVQKPFNRHMLGRHIRDGLEGGAPSKADNTTAGTRA
jgi:PAS domain S-box-containing protein